jgi:HK97 gp10 family phage protein
MRLEWHPEQLKKKILSDLAGNGEVVGKFLEGEARRRLMGITDPEWGEAYRGYVANLISSDSAIDGNGLLIRVGVGRGRSGSHHGLYIEFGSKTAAAHPFLRPAVFDNAAKIVGLLANR